MTLAIEGRVVQTRERSDGVCSCTVEFTSAMRYTDAVEFPGRLPLGERVLIRIIPFSELTADELPRPEPELEEGYANRTPDCT